MKALSTLLAIAVVFSSLPASAQIVNGDFSNGTSGWTITTPSGPDFIVLGENETPPECAKLGDHCPGFLSEESCLGPTFTCDDPAGDGSCVLTFRYKTAYRPCIWSMTDFRLRIDVDGKNLWEIDHKECPCAPDWVDAIVPLSAGTILLELHGYVLLGSILFADDFAVRPKSDTPVAPLTWGALKARYKG